MMSPAVFNKEPPTPLTVTVLWRFDQFLYGLSSNFKLNRTFKKTDLSGSNRNCTGIYHDDSLLLQLQLSHHEVKHQQAKTFLNDVGFNPL